VQEHNSETTPGTQEQSQLQRQLWREAAIAGISYWGILAALPYIRGVPAIPGTIAATIIFLLLSLAVIRSIARWNLRWQTEMLLWLLPLACWYGVSEWASAYESLAPVIAPFASLLFLISCGFLGRLLSRMIKDANMLLPIAVVLLIVDIFTVYAGPTGEALEKAPELVEKLSVGLPEMGSAAGPEGGKGLAYLGGAGLGDFIFLGLFLAAAWRYNLRFNRTFWLIFALMAVTMLGLLLVPVLPGVPMLPAIAIAFIIANVGAFDFSRQEKLYLLVGVVFVLILVGAYLLVRPMLG
jgi:hypothetical protein